MEGEAGEAVVDGAVGGERGRRVVGREVGVTVGSLSHRQMKMAVRRCRRNEQVLAQSSYLASEFGRYICFVLDTNAQNI